MDATAAVLLVVVVVVALVALAYNRLVKLRNRARAAWHDIDVYLRRRHDLVPNLVETVKAYAAHERGLFDEVARVRAAAVATEQDGRADEVASSEARLTEAVEQLVAVAEAYPDLKSDARFRDLQHELAATENKIAFSRQLYNDTVTAYQTATQSFPWVVVARPLGFDAPPLFSTAPGERDPVSVELPAPGAEGGA